MGLLDQFFEFMSNRQRVQPTLGSGMAERARQILASRPYQLHLQESAAMGVTPLTPEEFMLQMMQSQDATQQFQKLDQFGGIPGR